MRFLLLAWEEEYEHINSVHSRAAWSRVREAYNKNFEERDITSIKRKVIKISVQYSYSPIFLAELKFVMCLLFWNGKGVNPLMDVRIDKHYNHFHIYNAPYLVVTYALIMGE